MQAMSSDIVILILLFGTICFHSTVDAQSMSALNPSLKGGIMHAQIIKVVIIIINISDITYILS